MIDSAIDHVLHLGWPTVTIFVVIGTLAIKDLCTVWLPWVVRNELELARARRRRALLGVSDPVWVKPPETPGPSPAAPASPPPRDVVGEVVHLHTRRKR